MDNVDREWTVTCFVPDGISVQIFATTEREAIEFAKKRFDALTKMSSSFKFNSPEELAYYALPKESF